MRQQAILSLVLAAALLASCAAAAAPPRQEQLPAGSPAALLTGAAAPVLPLPATPRTPPAPVAASAAALQQWANPVAGWVTAGVGAVELSAMSPTRAARMLALMAIGMDAALGTASRARGAGRDVSDHAALSSAAGDILLAVQPVLASESTIGREAETAAWVGYWQGRDTPEGVALGLALGREVARAVLAAAAADGAAAAPRTEMQARDQDGAPIAQAPGVWVPTPRLLQPGADPQWGAVRPLVLPSGAAARVSPPPVWDSPAFQEVRELFRATQEQLTEAERAIAWKWDLRHGTITPVGVWYLIGRDLVLREQLGAAESARVFAVLGAAINDAVIACWESKYHYRVARPVQWMQETGAAHWLPPLIDTPNHPSYPSGHSVISAASATVLGRFFPAEAAALAEQAREASHSRVAGGIHWPIDAEAGLAQGEQVAELVISALGLQSASPATREH